ncbi:MAG: hypothetical protein JWR85_1656 [Marmoricola sp.]|nr:hypothetical protein [Marmoricola sp.]
MSTPSSDPAPPAHGAHVDFALAPALRARLLGTGLVAIGVVVVLGVLASWLTDLPSTVVSGLVVLAVVGVAALGLLLGLRHWVLRLDAHGYRVRALRSAEARSARWTDVLDLQATTVAGHRCVVLRLRDGRTTTLPVDVIEGGPTALTDALSAHLDRGHGYRRLR